MRGKLLVIGLIVSLSLICFAVGNEYGPTVMSWIGATTNGPITMAVVIEETAQPTKARGVCFGSTSNALRKSNRWRQFDKDQVPTEFAPLKDAATKAQTDSSKWQQWLFLMHDKAATWNGPLPETEALLVERVNQQGGL